MAPTLPTRAAPPLPSTPTSTSPFPSLNAVTALGHELALRRWDEPAATGFLRRAPLDPNTPPDPNILPALTRQQITDLYTWISGHDDAITFGQIFDHVNQTMQKPQMRQRLTIQSITLTPLQIHAIHQQYRAWKRERRNPPTATQGLWVRKLNNTYEAVKAFANKHPDEKLLASTWQNITDPDGKTIYVPVGRYITNLSHNGKRLPDDVWEAVKKSQHPNWYRFENNDGPRKININLVRKFDQEEYIYAATLAEFFKRNPDGIVKFGTIVHGILDRDGETRSVEIGQRYFRRRRELPPQEYNLLAKHQPALADSHWKGEEQDALYTSRGDRIGAGGHAARVVREPDSGSESGPESSGRDSGMDVDMESESGGGVFTQHVVLQLSGEPGPSLWQVSYLADGTVRLRNTSTGRELGAAPDDARILGALDDESADPPPTTQYRWIPENGDCFYETVLAAQNLPGGPEHVQALRHRFAGWMDTNEQAVRQWIDQWQTPTYRVSYDDVLRTVTTLGDWAGNGGDFVPNIAASVLNFDITIRIVQQHNSRTRAYNVTARPIHLSTLQPPTTHTLHTRLHRNHYTPLALEPRPQPQLAHQPPTPGEEDITWQHATAQFDLQEFIASLHHENTPPTPFDLGEFLTGLQNPHTEQPPNETQSPGLTGLDAETLAFWAGLTTQETQPAATPLPTTQPNPQEDFFDFDLDTEME